MDNGDRPPGPDTGAKHGRSLSAALENGRRYLEEHAFVAVGKVNEAWRKHQAARKAQAATITQPPAEALVASMSVTETALQSIIEVRRPIRPEFSAGSLALLVPAIVVAALVVMAIVSPALWLLVHQVAGGGPPPAFNPQAGYGSPY